ncbi:GNAT family N-acetyltransferase [Nocardioides sp. NPDC092400]|uniref:GNAT family N-acetyltransferase n=1 Tax=Nocardioides sp. NPDC092400 TaxID=3155196 RepID=UPI0034322C12
MGAPPAAPVVTVLAHTAHLAAADLAAARALVDAAFDDFTDADWSHALGGMHALVRVDGVLVAHGSLVQRRLLVGAGAGERSLRCGYVEAVATHPGQRRRGHATAVMAALEGLAAAYDLLALSSSDAGAGLYRGRGWVPWRGPTSVLGPRGRERTADDDGSTYVLCGPDPSGVRPLDLDLPLACDWREGDVW